MARITSGHSRNDVSFGQSICMISINIYDWSHILFQNKAWNFRYFFISIYFDI